MNLRCIDSSNMCKTVTPQECAIFIHCARRHELVPFPHPTTVSSASSLQVWCSACTYEKLSMGWPTCEMCTSSRYWKGCSVGKLPAPGGSDSQVPSIQDSGSTTGFILGGSEGRRQGQSVQGSCLQSANMLPTRSWQFLRKTTKALGEREVEAPCP